MLRAALYLNGSLYCDYRVQVYDCVDSEFFFAATVSLSVIRFVIVLMNFACAFIRVMLRKETAMNDLNFALLSYCVVATLQFISGIVVLSNTNIIAREIFWSMVHPLGGSNMALFLNALVAAISNSLLSHHQTKLPNARFRLGVLLSFVFFMVVGQVTLFGVIGGMEAGSVPPDSLQELFTAALALNGIFMFLFVLVLTYYGISFIKVAEEVLKDLKRAGIDTSGHTEQLLIITINKVRRQIRVFIYAVLYVVFVSFLYAFYEGFFTDLIFSKVMICIVNVGEGLGIAISLNMLVTEILKLKEVSGDTSTQSRSSFSGHGQDKDKFKEKEKEKDVVLGISLKEMDDFLERKP